jgi:hypothetical protein
MRVIILGSGGFISSEVEKILKLKNIKYLGLKRKDMGIDIIAQKDELYDAVQCKYKKANKFKSKNVLSWKTLSTFYALCMGSGIHNKENKREWNSHIVMTNCDYVRHVCEKTTKDLSICLKSFQKISKDEWLLMCNIEYHKLNEIITEDVIIKDNKNVLSKEELRKQRLLFYNKVIEYNP